MLEISLYGSELDEVDTALFAIIRFSWLPINLVDQTQVPLAHLLSACRNQIFVHPQINAKPCLLPQPEGVTGVNMVE